VLPRAPPNAPAAAAKSPEAAPPAWPPPKLAERRRAGEPLLWGTGLRKSHDGERVQFAALDLTVEKGIKTAVVGCAFRLA
jgi:ATPase subunit of ABC transporter with duplicated ATPase domains